MSDTATIDRGHRYGVIEFILVLVAAAMVGITAWYVQHSTTVINTNYSITESSQKASTPNQAVLERNKATE
jgi:hypothetical protein